MSKIVTCEECGIEYYSETIVPRMSFRHVYPDIVKLETELAEARAEIERLALEVENKQYTITCASEENQQLKESLADARAEIERLKNKENEADALLQKCLDLFEEQVERGEGL